MRTAVLRRGLAMSRFHLALRGKVPPVLLIRNRLVQMAHTWFIRSCCGDGVSRRYAMAGNEPFGFDPDDLDRFFPGAGDQLRGALAQFARMLNPAGEGRGRPGTFDELGRARRAAPASETTGDTGEGAWMIYTVDADGDARVEQVYATELEALRANKHNTDSNRSVRFLPYGIPVAVLDSPVAPASGDDPEA